MFLISTNKSSRTRFKKIEVHSNGITFICKTKKDIQSFPFEAIDKIHLSLNKRAVRSTYLYLFVVGCCVIMGFYYCSFILLLATLFFLLLVTSFLPYSCWMNLNRYPTYRLVIKLKTGNFFIKNISQAHKNDTIVMINHIKREKRLLR